MIRPKQSQEVTAKILRESGVHDSVCLLGVRGYYKHSMGDPNENDRGIYDDAIFLIAPGYYQSFNANTDPSVFRKGIAVLEAGLWRYKIGLHKWADPVKRYKALVQAEEVTVIRDDKGPDSGWFGINIHRGGQVGTSSLGCQTIIPHQWDEFIDAVQDCLKKANQKEIPYLLTEN